MSWPPVWVDDQGMPVYTLDADIPFAEPHPSTRNLPVPPDHVEDPFPAQYADAPNLSTQLRPFTRRSVHGIQDHERDHWPVRPMPHIAGGPSGDAQHSWLLNGSKRYVYGCSLSVVAEEKGAEEDSGLDLSSDKSSASAESASSGMSSDMAHMDSSMANCSGLRTSSSDSAPSAGGQPSNEQSPSDHLPADCKLSADLFSDDDTFYDAPSQLGSPLPVDWSSDDGYESAEAGSEESALDAEICSAIHCRRESVFTDDGSRFSVFSDSRRPSIATDTSSRRPSFATASESAFDSRRPSVATTVDDEDDGVPPVSPTTGEMLLNVWRSKRSSLLFIDPSALPAPGSSLLDTPISPGLPQSPGAASFMSAARPESVLLPDESESSADEDKDPGVTLATLKDFENDRTCISHVTARVYLKARIAPAQLVYYDLMLAASETAQLSRQARGPLGTSSRRQGSLQAIQVAPVIRV